MRTGDGGKRWQQLPLSAIPAPQAGEVAFAASGTCATTAPDGRGWIVTGNATQPRILSTQDFGETWTAQGVAAPGGEGIGLTSIAFESGPNPQRGIVVGGVIVGEDDSVPTVLVTSDGGATWQRQPSETVPFDGPLYGVAVAPEGPVAVAVGPQGAIWSSDRGVRQGSEITYAC